MTPAGWAVAAALVLAGAGLAAAWHRRTLDRLERMLDDALAGRFDPGAFDESAASALENRMARYLTASGLAAGQLAREKDRLKELVGDIAHQTRTPTANLLLDAQLLAEQPLPPPARVLADGLARQTEKLRFLIEALVKLSRLETGVLAVTPAPGTVRPVIERAVAQARPAADRKGVRLQAEPGDCPAVLDARWTAEALFNLLDPGRRAGDGAGAGLRVLLLPVGGGYRPRHPGGGTGPGVRAVLPGPGRRRHRGGRGGAVPGPADRLRPGRLPAAAQRRGTGVRLLAVSAPADPAGGKSFRTVRFAPGLSGTP